MFLTLLKGFTVGGSLIVAIGAQNVFVIKQGLKRQYLLLTALVCSLLDAIFIAVGVGGFGHLVSAFPGMIVFMKYFAILFLLIYGALSFKSVFKSKQMDVSSDREISLKNTILVLLALTVLNPHAYLDTVVLLGTIAAQQTNRIYFALGAIIASFIWFFAITYGVSLLSPLLQKKSAWKVIDGLSGLTMWGIALTLYFSGM